MFMMRCRLVRSLWVNSLRLPSRWLPSRRINTHFRTISTSSRFHSLDTSTIAQAGALYHPEPPPFTTPTSDKRPQTLTEKIVQRYAVDLPEGKLVRSGDYIILSPAYCMTCANSSSVEHKFMRIGATQVRNPRQMVFALEHGLQNSGDTELRRYQQMKTFAEKHSIDHLPPGRGSGHQIMVEEGYAWPDTMCAAYDSFHSNHYGGVGCLSTPIVRTDAASIWATSRTWWHIPPVARVNFVGTLRPGVTARDVAAVLNIFFGSDVRNHAIEFTGSEETMASLPVDSRLTIANMTHQMGALSGLFPMDKTLERWLRYKATEAAMLDDRTTRQRITHEKVDELFVNPLTADLDAVYAKQLYLNLDTLGFIPSPDTYEPVPTNWSGIQYGYSMGAESTTEDQLSHYLQQMESLIERVESIENPRSETDILPGFPEKISGEIVFCDADNLNADAILRGKYPYQVYHTNPSKEKIARVCMKNYDPQFSTIIRPNDILVSGFNFGCGPTREHAGTAILANQIPLVVAGSLSFRFSRNNLNSALMGLEIPRLIERLRAHFTSPSNERQLTRRTGWTLTWDLKRSRVEVQEGEGGEIWTEQSASCRRMSRRLLQRGGWRRG